VVEGVLEKAVCRKRENALEENAYTEDARSKTNKKKAELSTMRYLKCGL
jgi:hypothetical protein